jgi:hypothetical protein
MNPSGGIGSETGEVFGAPPPFKSLRGVKSRVPLPDFFPSNFSFDGVSFLCSGLIIVAGEFARQVEPRQGLSDGALLELLTTKASTYSANLPRFHLKLAI